MVSELKQGMVTELKKLTKEYPIVGVVDMQNLPAPQLQSLRGALRGKVELKMTRRRLLKLALQDSDKKVLIDYIDSAMPALIFTKENPFSLYKTLQKNKSTAPAKAGQTAPNDITVQAGPTPFAPGPVIGELGAIGIKTGVEGGKVAIKSDSVVCKRGEVIKPKVAEVLKRLGIEPMEIGLNIVAVIENGTIFRSEQLEIDQDKFMSNLSLAISGATNLSVEVSYPTAETIELIVQKAAREAKSLALEAKILSKDTARDILAACEREALALTAHGGW